MGLYKQAKSKNWFMRFRDENGRVIRRSTGTANKSAATMILADEERAVLNRKLGIAAPSPSGEREPIRHAVDRFLKDEIANGLSQGWADKQRSRFEMMIEDLRWRSLKDINTQDLQEYIAHHPTAKVYNTKCQYIMHVSKLCQWAMMQTPPLMASNPAKAAMPTLKGRAAKVEEHRDVRRPLWTYEIPRFLSARPTGTRARNSWDQHRYPLYVMVLRTGFRRSTLNRLTPASIHLDVANPHIAVPAELTKSGRPITMPLMDDTVIECVEQLLRNCADRSRHHPFVNQPFAPTPRPKTFTQDIERAGIPRVDELGRHVVFHSLRSTFCTQLAIAGVPAQVAMELMDHKNLETTMRYYTRVGVSDKRRFISDLPDVHEGAAGMLQSMSRSRHTGVKNGVC